MYFFNKKDFYNSKYIKFGTIIFSFWIKLVLTTKLNCLYWSFKINKHKCVFD